MAVTSTIDLDPWGGETTRSSNQAFPPHRYTSYERDANGGDEAMMRRYTGKWHRFDQPDPYDGSYDLRNPQSFNRYAYTRNDPVNFVDPSGLHWELINCHSHVAINPEGFPYFDGSEDCEIAWVNDGPAGGGGDIEPRGGGGGPQKPKPTPLDPKEIQRRIAEGKAWDKWQQWVNCNTPIMNKYNAQLNNVRRFFGPASSRDIGAGVGAFAAIFFDLNPIGVTVAGYLIWTTIDQDRNEVYDIISNYKSEVTKECGPKPPHP